MCVILRRAGGRGARFRSEEFPLKGGNLLPGTIICLLFFAPLPPVFSLRPPPLLAKANLSVHRKHLALCSSEGVEREKKLPAVSAEAERTSERL